MKRIGTVLLIASLLLVLAACSDSKGSEMQHAGNTGQASADKQGAELAEELAEKLGLEGDGWIASDPKEPYGKYRTEAEWEAIFRGEADYDNTPVPVRYAPPDPIVVDEESGAAYTGEEKIVTFDETNAAEGEVGCFDWKSQLTEEELAQWEAFDPNDPKLQALLEQSGQVTEQLEGIQGEIPDADMDEVQQQIDDAMKQALEELENIDLPEGYEQYLPEGMDLESLLGGALSGQP